MNRPPFRQNISFSVDRTLGLLSQTMGNLDQAAAHFEDALAFCRNVGYRPEMAWTWWLSTICRRKLVFIRVGVARWSAGSDR